MDRKKYIDSVCNVEKGFINNVLVVVWQSIVTFSSWQIDVERRGSDGGRGVWCYGRAETICI